MSPNPTSAAGMYDAQEVANALYLLAAAVGLVGALALYLKWRRPYLALSWASLALAAGGAVPSVTAQVDLPGVAQGGFWIEASPWVSVMAFVAAVAFAGLDLWSRHSMTNGARPDLRTATSVGVGNAAATDHSASASGKGSTAIVGAQYNAPVQVGLAPQEIVDKLIEQSRSVGQLQGQVARLETDLESERRLRQEAEAALTRTAKLADEGDAPARRAIDEARRSGDMTQLQAVLVDHADRRGREVLAGAADFLELCREIAAVTYLRGDIDEARKRLDLILRFNPDDREAHNRLGQIQRLRGDWEAAEKSYGRVLALSQADPSWQATAYGNLGLIHRTRGDLDRAEEMHRRSLAIEERLGSQAGMANQYGNLGLIHELRGDVRRARDMWTQARDLFAQIGMPHMVTKTQCLLDGLPQ